VQAAECVSSAHAAIRRNRLAHARVREHARPAARAASTHRIASVKFLIALLLWCLLFVACWPLALLALVLWPLAWLVLLPFRLVGITFEALFAFLRALFLLPARLLGDKPAHAAA
jgi:hypothetical protein